MIPRRKPKLLLIADTYYPKVDGTLRFVEEFLKRSSEFEASLLVPFQGEKQGKNVTFVQPSSWIHLSGYPGMKLNLRNWRMIERTIASADIVFVQGPALLSYLSIYCAHRQGKKVVFYTHTLPWELIAKFLPRLLRLPIAYLVRKLCTWLYNHCTAIYVPYHGLREYLGQEGVHVPITVARLGVDIDRFTPSKDKRTSKLKIGLPPQQKVIGYVGRISKEKNTHILKEAYLKLRHKEHVHLLLVGDGPRDQTDEFRSIQNCTITGFVTNVQDYLPAMDIFIMPSLTETTSLATLEAMSCGLPVLATRVGFIQNYLVKEYNGQFIPRNNASVLAAKIEKLLRDKSLQERLGHNARKTIAYSFSWERSINKIKRLLLKEL